MAARKECIKVIREEIKENKKQNDKQTSLPRRGLRGRRRTKNIFVKYTMNKFWRGKCGAIHKSLTMSES